MELPNCQVCNENVLIPFSELTEQQTNVSQVVALTYARWVCANPNCGYIIESLREGKLIHKVDLRMGEEGDVPPHTLG